MPVFMSVRPGYFIGKIQFVGHVYEAYAADEIKFLRESPSRGLHFDECAADGMPPALLGGVKFFRKNPAVYADLYKINQRKEQMILEEKKARASQPLLTVMPEQAENPEQEMLRLAEQQEKVALSEAVSIIPDGYEGASNGRPFKTKAMAEAEAKIMVKRDKKKRLVLKHPWGKGWLIKPEEENYAGDDDEGGTS